MLDNEKKLSLSKVDRKPNLQEKIDIVNDWFTSMDPGKNFK